MWKDLGFEENNQDFFGLNLEEWLKKFCGTSIIYPRPRVPWKILFPQAIWTIWLHRNKAIFQTGRVEEGTSTLCLKKGVEFYAIVPNEPNKPSRVQVQVKWTKRPRGWVKLNTGGTMYGNPIKVGGGGVLRSSNGDWIGGFARKLGNTSSTMAELWALKDGLTMAKQMGIENICIEMDAKFIVQLVSRPSVVNLMLEPLLIECRNLIQTFPNSLVVHVFKEANGCADQLARMGAELDVTYFLCLFNPLDVVVEMMASDKVGLVCCNRLIVL